jgi:hypothetical protein
VEPSSKYEDHFAMNSAGGIRHYEEPTARLCSKLSNSGFHLAPDEVVFVLPDYTRLGTPFAAGSSSLLDTARLLMACTPNGI